MWIDGHSSLHPIHSSSDGLEGYVDIDLDDKGRLDLARPPAGSLSLAVSRLSSGNRLEDRELQKRVDVRRFPTIDGVLEAMEADGDGSYRVSGKITFRGVAKECRDQMTVQAVDGTTLQLTGASRFDVRDFGLEPPRLLMLRVEPEVDVRVEITATKEE